MLRHRYQEILAEVKRQQQVAKEQGRQEKAAARN
jgi:hypothetical protein